MLDPVQPLEYETGLLSYAKASAFVNGHSSTLALDTLNSAHVYT